jgi:hypothetical protein
MGELMREGCFGGSWWMGEMEKGMEGDFDGNKQQPGMRLGDGGDGMRVGSGCLDRHGPSWWAVLRCSVAVVNNNTRQTQGRPRRWPG